MVSARMAASMVGHVARDRVRRGLVHREDVEDLLHPLVLREDALAAPVDAFELLLEERLHVGVGEGLARRPVRARDADADLLAADLDLEVGDRVGARVVRAAGRRSRVSVWRSVAPSQ